MELIDQLQSQVFSEQNNHISLIKEKDIPEVCVLISDCFNHNGFDGSLSIADTAISLKNIICEDEHLAIKYSENGKVLGAGIFMLVPNLFNRKSYKVTEIMWDSSPHISRIKRGRVMISILNFMIKYYHGIGDISRISIPLKNKSVMSYLIKKGFRGKEVSFIKEL